MAVTAPNFRADFPFFAGRTENAITRAIRTATAMYDQDKCGDLYDAIVEYQTAINLLSDPGGAPTRKTKSSGNMMGDYQARLDGLVLLTGQRGLVVR